MLNEPRGDVEPTPTASEQPRPGALTPPSSEVNFCASCGAGRPDAAAFCPTCGTAFRPTVATPAPPAVPTPTQTVRTPVQPTRPSGWVEPRPRNAPKLLQPVHLGADIGDLPRLMTRGYSVLVPGLILIVVFALFGRPRWLRSAFRSRDLRVTVTPKAHGPTGGPHSVHHGRAIRSCATRSSR